MRDTAGVSPTTDVPVRLGAALADRYAIRRELGQGGMATVYLATDLRHRRDVALKVLRPSISIGPDRLYLTVSEYESDIWVANLRY